MNAEFKLKKVGDKDVEFVVLSGGFMGKDSAERPATDADRAAYSAEYEAFKNPPAPPEDKDAKIAALEAELAKAQASKDPGK